MYRKVAAILLLSLLLMGCRLIADEFITDDPTPTPFVAVDLPSPVPTEVAQLPTDAPTDTPIPTEEPPTAAPPPTSTPVPTEPPTAVPTELPTEVPDDLSISAENITLYPVPQLYTGDVATFQIAAFVPDQLNPYEVPLEIRVDGEIILSEPLGGWRNLNGDTVGLYQWAWDVGDEAGTRTVEVILDPNDSITDGDAIAENNVASIIVDVVAEAALPELAQDQIWDSAETPYAKVHVVTGTAAHRDKEMLVSMVDQAVLEAADVLGVPPVVDRKVEIFFIDRIIGQGGYAGSAMVISYLDRNYAGGGLYEVLVHESLHVLDANLEPQDRFSFLTEGLAVYGTGGHYKLENLDQRAAGLLLESDGYIPLDVLINDFYPAQHEIGYLQAGAFLNYIAATYGKDQLLSFYKMVTYKDGRSIAESLSDDMVTFFGKTLSQMEADWHAYLKALPRTTNEAIDLELTIAYYDLMRDYQLAYDPTAHYLYAWLPSPRALLDGGHTASLTRHPVSMESIALETMLEAADNALRDGDFAQTRVLLDSVSRTLISGQFLDPIAAYYFQIAETAESLGFEAQDITLDMSGQPTATLQATDPTTNELSQLTLLLEDAEWIVTQ